MKARFDLPGGKIVMISVGAALMIWVTGCSSDPMGATVRVAKAASAAPAGSNGTKAEPEANLRSVFAADAAALDPFYPRSKTSVMAAEPMVSQDGPIDVYGILQAGFKGVIGAGGSQLALVHNALLEPGRTAVVSAPVGNQRREIKVKVMDITPNSVTLEAQGHAGPVTLRTRDK